MNNHTDTDTQTTDTETNAQEHTETHRNIHADTQTHAWRQITQTDCFNLNKRCFHFALGHQPTLSST